MSQQLLKTPKALSCQSHVRASSMQLGKLTSHPTSIRPSNDEIQEGRLSSRNLEVAIRSLHRDGLVVVENVIPHDSLNRLNEKMVEDAYTLQSRKGDSPYNYNPGNIQQDAPPIWEYFDKNIFMSKSLHLQQKPPVSF